MLHENRVRADSFGHQAALYDRARPSYPDALIDDLLAGGAVSVVDVGCGTGIVSRQLTARGCTVLGVEADDRMASIARANGIAVEVSSFEEWDVRDRTFDLLTAGQAWHWVDPVAGGQKAVTALRPGGRIALFWNQGHPAGELRSALEAVYDRLAPGVKPSTMLASEGDSDRFTTTAAMLRRIPQFGSIEIRRYPWEDVCSRDSWVDRLRTHSTHTALDDSARERLMEAVGSTVDNHGGLVEMVYTCWLVTAIRAGLR